MPLARPRGFGLLGGPGGRRLRVAIVNDYEVIVAGVAAMLEPHADRVEVSELDVDRAPAQPADVALFDTYGQYSLGLPRVRSLVDSAMAGADLLFVSENTVRTHLKAVFRRLDVSTRSHAVVRALSDPSFAVRRSAAALAEGASSPRRKEHP